MTFSRDEHCFCVERAIRAYFGSIGRAMIPCHEFYGRTKDTQGAPIVWRDSDRIVLPDLIETPGGAGFDVKTQGYAPFLRMAGVRTTGFKKRHYREYLAYEVLAQAPVTILFVHLQENEIRGGHLAEIESAKTRRVNILDHDGHRGDVYWEYDRLPVAFPGCSAIGVLEAAVRYSQRCGLRDGYTAADHATVLAYRDRDARSNADKHRAEWAEVEA